MTRANMDLLFCNGCKANNFFHSATAEVLFHADWVGLAEEICHNSAGPGTTQQRPQQSPPWSTAVLLWSTCFFSPLTTFAFQMFSSGFLGNILDIKHAFK